LIIHLTNAQKKIPLDTRRVRSLTRRIMKELKLHGRELGLLLTDDEGIRELNRLYLHRDRPTNVISFPMNEGTLLGDIAISVETAARDAQMGGLSLLDEIAFLVIHGLLHLIGYDHEDGDEKKAALMKEKEKELFSTITGYEID